MSTIELSVLSTNLKVKVIKKAIRGRTGKETAIRRASKEATERGGREKETRKRTGDLKAIIK